MPPETKMSLIVEVPDDLYQRVQAFLEANPAWCQDDFLHTAITLLLVQLTDSSTNNDARLYLDRMFYRLWGKEAA